MNENYILILRKKLAEIRELSYNLNDETLSAAVEELEEALSHFEESLLSVKTDLRCQM